MMLGSAVRKRNEGFFTCPFNAHSFRPRLSGVCSCKLSPPPLGAADVLMLPDDAVYRFNMMWMLCLWSNSLMERSVCFPCKDLIMTPKKSSAGGMWTSFGPPNRFSAAPVCENVTWLAVLITLTGHTSPVQCLLLL